MTTDAAARPVNTVARVAFALWLAGILIPIVAAIIGLFFGMSSGDRGPVVIAPIIASFAYAPLFFIALITAVAALTRTGRPKGLAIITLVLAIVTAPLSLAFFASAVTLVTN
jgi:hypothetical protein